MRVVFIGSKELACAYALIGIKPVVVKSKDEFLRKYDSLINSDVDIVVIEENLYKCLREYDKYRPGSQIKPVFVVVPGLHGSEGYRLKDLYNLISEAVGAKLELGR